MMGVTMSCARCHNHKFDPVSIQDYYSMTAVFEDIEFGSRYPEFSKDHPRKQLAEEIWKKIASERNKIRNLSDVWEEDWGGYKEFHWKPEKATAIRLNFWSGYVGLDELQVYGSPSEIRTWHLHQMDQKFTQIRCLLSRATGSLSPELLMVNLVLSAGRQVTTSPKNKTHG